ncbi:Na+/H+ antiporter NhaC family protein [Myroides odoratimimus]|uniref:Sodium:proton antiporter n=1 Tax=Myroides odoratimimus TaxID=76832 RepID=A0AAI8C8K9_9FLAO|nr:Na+/H+ antiporter NhaC family protein [Myroides odoratimimus]ALU28122.1 sodium:proton antiporter [Myroides odoratimimus]MDM1039472.1 Na+/H+ antiporter NhaC family protein [Myroides odoratimimus]MDM1053702.1 Na+/H+ antiporter NhaC family protein [Myroides odoratimimus]MDM1444918.1 Na+/H+ antiporter NhaC family protein [Myroides odoratimimus]MDM1450971.1 Na+/H+ antiporter NhaC family protein [Myroides odoratimimus]
MKAMSDNKFYTFIPFFIFIAIFLGSGILLGDFYKMPSPIAISVGVVSAFLLFYKTPMQEKVISLIQGCGDSKIITMCIIYLLAGAFAAVTKAIGGVDTMVNMGLSVVPIEYLTIGIFVIACFLSLAIGTSVGTIVALGPIVVGLAEKSGSPMGLLCGTLLGGAMFGDNLSIISDTTITATQTVGCEMKDKFRANFKLALPAALITIVGLLFMSGGATDVVLELGDTSNFWVIIPYILIIVLALVGVQVFVALFISILVAGIIGLVQADFDVLGFANLTYEGFVSMNEIFLLSMLTGGLAKMVEDQGGIQWLLKQMKKLMKSPKGAEFGIAGLVSSIGVCLANNTVSILVAGNLARDIATEYELDRPRVASILDIFACIIQGILPYGAQILILLSFTNGQIDYLDLMKYSYYFVALLIITLTYMIFLRKNTQTT